MFTLVGFAGSITHKCEKVIRKKYLGNGLTSCAHVLSYDGR